MSTQPEYRLTPTQYLNIERDSEKKHEFHDGQMFAMAGASREHNRIVGNLYHELRNQLKKGPCEPFVSDMRVKVDANGLYTYPDVSVVCEEPRFEDDAFDTLLNPLVVIEVLSETSERYDRGKKFELYRDLPSLREYVLVSQDAPHVDHFARQDDEHWLLSSASGLEAVIELPAAGARLRLSDIYAKVKFAAD